MANFKKVMMGAASGGASYWLINIDNNDNTASRQGGIAIADNEDCYLAFQNTSDSYNTGNILVVDGNGEEVAQKKIDFGSNSIIQGLAVDSSTNIYATMSYDDLNVTKLNSSFALQWSKSSIDQYAYGYPGEGHSIDVDSSGNVYVVGTGFDNGSWNSIYVAKFTSAGAISWQVRIGTTSQGDNGYSIRVNSDGTRVAIGAMFYDGGYRGAGVAVFNTSTGAKVWDDGVGNSIGRTYGVSYDSSDNLYITGYDRTSGYRAFAAKYNSSGTRQWCTELKGSNNTFSYGGDIDSSANVYLATQVSSENGRISKINSSGTYQWSYQIAHADATAAGSTTRPSGLMVTPSGDIVMGIYWYDGTSNSAGWLRCGPDGPPTGTYGDWTITASNINSYTGTTQAPSGQGTGTFTNTLTTYTPTIGNLSETITTTSL